jgi:hypothetical protein
MVGPRWGGPPLPQGHGRPNAFRSTPPGNPGAAAAPLRQPTAAGRGRCPLPGSDRDRRPAADSFHSPPRLSTSVRRRPCPQPACQRRQLPLGGRQIGRSRQRRVALGGHGRALPTRGRTCHSGLPCPCYGATRSRLQPSCFICQVLSEKWTLGRDFGSLFFSRPGGVALL